MERINAWLEQARSHLRLTGRPAVTLSYAQSLDGCLTVRRGERYVLSGPESSTMTHLLRSTHDAILVGIGTVLADNPHLTVRLTPGPDPRPIVLDTHLRIPLDSQLLKREENMPWIACGASADEEKLARLEERKVRLIPCRLDKRKQIDLADLLAQLLESGVRSVMIEGGTSVITSFIEAQLVDFVVLTIAPIWLGGLHVVETELPDGVYPGIKNPQSTWMGKDLILWGAVERSVE
jgi:GTP cyclohydrolase II